MFDSCIYKGSLQQLCKGGSVYSIFFDGGQWDIGVFCLIFFLIEILFIFHMWSSTQGGLQIECEPFSLGEQRASLYKIKSSWLLEF